MIQKLMPARLATYPNLVLLGGFAIGIFGPFGQADRFLPVERIGLWVAYLALGLPLIYCARSLISRTLNDPPWMLTGLFSAIITSIPILLWVEALGVAQGRGLPSSISDWTWSAGEVLLTAFCVACSFDIYSQLTKASSNSDALRRQTNDSALTIEQLIEPNAGLIYGFCAEGHYTRIYGQFGERFIHRSFSDLISRTTTLKGAQVHRSWWVADGAVESFNRTGSAGELTLVNGLKVPVARRRLSDKRVRALYSH
ncbi:MAG: LytTR family DNA-binding domain-containing protein [Henriciella sp.]|jgi:hypothetical protein